MNGYFNGTGWTPMPRYLCRKRLVISLINKIKPKIFLEVGIGSGDLFISLLKLGYRGVGIDLSGESINIVTKKIVSEGLNKRGVVKRVSLQDFHSTIKFDLVLALEVLEHIENDIEAFVKMQSLINKDGKILISVPAHKSKWGATDVWAGHLRRYDRDEIIKKAREVGLIPELILCYNLQYIFTKPLRDFIYKQQLERHETFSMRTLRSGVRSMLKGRLFYLLGHMLYKVSCNRFTDIFLKYNLGEGYIVCLSKE